MGEIAARPCGVGWSESELNGTGFGGNAGTGWYNAKGAAVAGEVLGITFFIADMGDTAALVTVVLLNNFRWDCIGYIPSEFESCGIQPQ